MSKLTVSIKDIRVADIIVSTTDAKISQVIRQSIGADISHSMLYTEFDKVIEAIDVGVKERPLLAEAVKDATLAIVLRRVNMTDERKKKVVEFARGFAGRPYDKVGAAGSGMSNKRGKVMGTAGCMLSPIACAIGAEEIARNASDKNKDKKFFCSELVARAFELAGVPIVDGKPTFTNPRNVRTASRLRYVGHLIG